MKSKWIAIQTFVFFLLSISFAQKYSDFSPGEIWKDNNGIHINAHGAGMLIYNGVYYWFGEHKIEGGQGNKAMVGVHVYSSTDMYNWHDQGIALKMLDDENSMLQRGSVVERPKVIYNKKTGKFVMWFHHELKDQGYKAALTGVAVADAVTGPYTYQNSFRLHPSKWPLNFNEEQQQNVSPIKEGEKPDKKDVAAGGFLVRDFEQGQMSRDMTLFVDDDEQAYHITASEENNTLLISKLADDYLSLTDEYVRVFPAGRNEAPAIFKKDGKYYMFTSGLTGWKPNPGRSAVSDNMMEGWNELGNPCRGTEEENNSTFWSQSTYVLPVQGRANAFIFVADRWRPENAIDGRYIWLPVQWEDDKPVIKWYDKWNLNFFNN
jgi:Glycosyl hydrolases family 43